MRYLSRGIQSLILGTLLTACAQTALLTQPAETTPRLAGTEWVLEAMNGTPPARDTTVTLEFDKTTFGGRSGCNHYGGDYEATVAGLEFEHGPMTAMACEAAVMAQESAYMDALNAVATYEIDQNRLELLGRDSGEVLRFARARP